MAFKLNITLPDHLMAYVEAQVESGDYATPSEYITELIRNDRDHRRQALEERLLESLHGDGITLSSEEVERGGVINLLREKMKDRQGRAA